MIFRNNLDVELKDIPRPDEIPAEMRSYVNENPDFHRWIADFQHSPEYPRLEADERFKMYRSVYRTYREMDVENSGRVHLDLYLSPDDAGALHSHLDRYGLTLEEFVMQSLQRANSR
jgi:hypothetical protein